MILMHSVICVEYQVMTYHQYQLSFKKKKIKHRAHLRGLEIFGKGVSVLAWMLALLISLLSLKFYGTTLLKFCVHSLLQLSSEEATVWQKRE
jgi:hypothetical protein